MKKRILKYIGVGITLSIFNFGVYTILARLINNSDLLWLSNMIATLLATILAFILHSKITWKERHPGKAGVIRFFIWNLILAVVFAPFLTWFFGLFPGIYEFAFNICQAIHLPFDYEFVESTGIFALGAVVTTIINYLFYDKFVFGATKDAKKSAPKPQEN